MDEIDVDEVFPFPEYRHKQKDLIQAGLDALYEDGYKNLVIDAPTGCGKSAINLAFLRASDSGFYTTPMKKLREQLQSDDGLNDHFRSLRAREDYTCEVSGENCKDCHINQASDQSCSEFPNQCSYWAAKMGAINHDISVLTFSYLIIDSMIPERTADGTQISFGDRDMLVVDEAHGLVDQCASLHAGFKLSPYSLPWQVFQGTTDSVSWKASSYEEVKDEVNEILSRCIDYIPEDIPLSEMEQGEKQCKKKAEKIRYMNEQIEEGYPWVVDVESVSFKGQKVKQLMLKPIDVSGFLRNFVWNRADKRVISTATLPYRGNPGRWLRQVGLDPEKTKVLTVGMPFPVKNRPIHTSSMVGKMSSGGIDDHWDDIMKTMNKIAESHYNEKGLVHTSSYSRAERVLDTVDKDKHPYLHDNMMIHRGQEETEVIINDWQNSDKDIMLSPSMMEGLDLVGDKCRYQMLMKVPLPALDSRMEYILDNEDWGWSMYWEKAMIRVAQSYGRAVRSPEDYADFYCLDRDFDRLLKKRTPPEWLEEAVDVAPPQSRSLFDY